MAKTLEQETHAQRQLGLFLANDYPSHKAIVLLLERFGNNKSLFKQRFFWLVKDKLQQFRREYQLDLDKSRLKHLDRDGLMEYYWSRKEELLS